ncbi:MAG: DUF4231 domain-containing protein [Gammaproteobacteria bacterium]|nr:DUF4231 domain-containing protein [Gammaproteobacteria bacterium]
MNNTTVPELDPNAYLTERVNDQLKYYEKAATRAKREYTWMQSAVIVLGLIVPVAVNLPVKWGTEVDISLEIKIAVTLMSLTVAILNGLLNFGKQGDKWLSYRMTEELLKREKFMYLSAAGKYVDKQTAFAEFVTTVESIISAEHNKFRTLLEDAKRPTKDQPGQHGRP